MHEVVLGTVPDFIDFDIHLPTFLWQLRCFVERIIKKRLSDSFIHNSVIVRLSANSSCVFHHGQRPCQTFLQFRLPRQLILKFNRDLQDWIALWTSESKTVISV